MGIWGLKTVSAGVAVLLLTLLAAAAYGENFVVTSTVEPQSARPGGTVDLSVKFTLAEGIHLYKDKITFDWEQTDGIVPGNPALPKPITVPDPLDASGRAVIEAYEKSVTVIVPMTVDSEAAGTKNVIGVVHYQGCTDTMCFMPMQFRLSHDVQVAGLAVPAVQQPPAGGLQQPVADSTAAAQPTPAAAEQGFLVRVLMAFGVGILISLTPCVYPLIPITAAIVSGGRQTGEGGVLESLLRSVVYVLGLSIIYAALGVLSATLGGAFSQWLKTAWVIVPVAIVFVALGLSMFDLFTIQTPSFISGRASPRRSTRRLVDVFTLGLVAGIVATPCVAAPLAGMLTFIATTGNRLLGFCMLFSLAWGMGLFLIIIGTTAGSFMPKAGSWMEWIKKALGFAMFWAAAYFAMPVIGSEVYKLISAIIIVAAVVFLGGLDTLSPSSGFANRLKRTVGIVATILAVLLLIDAVGNMTGRRFGAPSASYQASTGAFTPSDGAALERALASGRPTVVELYADWCTICKKLERTTLSSAEVASRLANVNALKLDYDRNSELISKYNIPGVPTIMFFDDAGREARGLRLSGYVEPDKLLAAVDSLIPATK